ncbi:MAG TPA: tRNA (N(6)-L-threonylcarbamoyladenosine(37)-C(2))-methylthiotransferase MtaB [Anaerolineaceae bacterium]|nr:tRNA (N(6)-L-threonylcarbamoyladenosine(37)-C(2))-methylthiotransferase MtaB [Anaerolineaceae bacterium]
MKVFFDTVGCRLNQAEIEHLAGEFRSAGHVIVDSADGADLVVLNTCAVTAGAASDSRQKVRQAQHAGAKSIVVTGCLATLDPGESANLPGVSLVVPNAEKDQIPGLVLGQIDIFDLEPLARHPLPGARKRTRAFIKVQDGCDNLCTFCVTRIARGSAESVPKEAVLQQVIAATTGGAREVVLTGVHLGCWGRDLREGENLVNLVAYLLDKAPVERLRLSSTEPWDLDERFFDLWQDSRMCRHLHLPLQSGSAGVLRRMARRTTPEEYRALLKHARSRIPGLAVTTDIIVGFPGETDEEYNESLEFVKEMEFSGGHVFRYSARPGTAAARFPGRVHGSVAKERARMMRSVLDETEQRYAQGFIGANLKALWETAESKDNNWLLRGLTDNYIQVTALAKTDRSNHIDTVRIESIDGNILSAANIT